MSKQSCLDVTDDECVYVTVRVPWPELKMLRETLKLSAERTKGPTDFIRKTALDDAISHASSTVTTNHWPHLRAFARKTGVESPI
jgi:dihydroxyacid dehydratase/phosphogluconate dehydratase